MHSSLEPPLARVMVASTRLQGGFLKVARALTMPDRLLTRTRSGQGWRGTLTFLCIHPQREPHQSLDWWLSLVSVGPALSHKPIPFQGIGH
ncbi:MAG: hypothetical protein ACJ8AG_30005 [Ktedonobacteraceae bacterium]